MPRAEARPSHLYPIMRCWKFLFAAFEREPVASLVNYSLSSLSLMLAL